MGFSTPIFLFAFLPVMLAFYFLSPARARNAILFAGSLFFYAWGENYYILVLLASLTVNYALANGISAGTPRRQRLLVVLAMLFNLGLLVGFKYVGFLLENLPLLRKWLHLGGSFQGAHLPIGISFFTFQAMSYVLDVYRREVPAQRNFLHFGLYVFLFPHLIAGPIVRYRDIAEQLPHRPVTLAKFASGVRRFAIGLCKKMLLANTLAEAADKIFALPAGELAPSAAWLGIACYTLQIYFDFSGYSDMAIGLGRMFGFDFLENFRFPYVAQSVTDFWRRWHISLSSWFRDYLYIPLGGNRRGSVRTYANLMVVFLLCGLWHGANWTFIIWGGFHGLFLIFERLGLGRWLERTWAPLRHGYVLIVVMVGWVFFRSTSTQDATRFLGAMVGRGSGGYQALDFAHGELLLALAAGVVASMPALAWLKAWRYERLLAPGRPAILRRAWGLAEFAIVYALLFAAVVRLTAETYQPFIYFRF